MVGNEITGRALKVAPSVAAPNSAFISYAREDEPIAAALQNGLIEMANTSFGQVEHLRVFRDTTNLVPGLGLSDALRGAIDASGKLILLASPHAAKSRWVGLELSAFLQNRAPQEVIVVLVAGELKWDEQHRAFIASEQGAFPDLGRSVFPTEPIYLDLRGAAASGRAPTLRDESFRDVVATLLAAISGTRKDDLVGHFVDMSRRQSKQLQFNLGFRGAIGFASGVLLTALASILITRLIPGDFELLHPRLPVANVFASCVPVLGIGALVCRLGVRGYLATTTSFVIAAPFLAATTVRVFDDSLLDKMGLALCSLLGFGFAGAAFACVMGRFGALRVVAIYVAAGALASTPFLLFEALRLGSTDFQVFTFPWLLDRFALVVRALPQVLESVSAWCVAIACSAWIGALLGREQGRVDLPAFTSARKVRRWRTLSLVRRPAMIGAAILATLPLITRLPWIQTRLVSHDLDPTEVGANLGISPTRGDSIGKLVQFGVQARDALRRAGRNEASEQISGLLSQWIAGYLHGLEGTDLADPALSESLQTHAREIEPFIRKAVLYGPQSPERLALLSRVARRINALEIADSALKRSLETLSTASSPQLRGEVALALLDADRVSDAVKIIGDLKFEKSLREYPCRQEFAQALWKIGIWKNLPEATRRDWSCNSGVAVAMMETGDWEEALETLRTAQHLLGFRETSIQAAATVAADRGRFDIAQRAADLLRDDRIEYAECQRAIGERANSRRNEAAFSEVAANLARLVSDAASASNYSDLRDLELSYWRTEFRAGHLEAADRILKAMSPSFAAVEALVEQAEVHMRQQKPTLAKRTLASAWIMLHEAQGRIDPQCQTLGKISTQLLAMNDHVGARVLALECKPWRFEAYWLERYAALAKLLDAYTS